MSDGLQNRMTHLNHPFQNCKPFRNRNVKTIKVHVVVHFAVASLSSFRDFPKRSFRVGDGSGGMNAVCSQLELVYNVISGDDEDTFQ